MGEATRVVVAGFGRLGSVLAQGLAQAAETEVVGVARRTPGSGTIELNGRSVPVSADLPVLLEEVRPRVLVEASLPEAALRNARAALERGVSPVVATSGVSKEAEAEIARLCRERGVGAVVAPNLSLGVVVLVHLASVAARFFESAEIIEMHRDKKLDAPSGTALYTARVLAQARGAAFVHAPTEKYTLDGVRGGDVEGVGIHSVRLPGLIAHQEVIFGGLGQTLTLRHDTTSQESYVPGTLMAIRHVTQSTGLTVGLAALLGLE
jgi:4-hydroxy-tetrahydrodipicolinate reductase